MNVKFIFDDEKNATINFDEVVVKDFDQKLFDVKVLMLKGEKGDAGVPTQEQVDQAVEDYFEEYPEHVVPDDSVSTDKIQDGAVTHDKLAADAVPIDSSFSATSGNALQNKVITSGKADIIIDEVSGPIVSFPDGAAIPADSLVVNINPIQDLHGYDHPWTGGGGKNKLPVSTKMSSTGTVSFTNNNDGSWVVDGSSGGSNTYVPGGSKCISLGVLASGDYTASLHHTDGQLSSILGVRIGEGSDSTYLASGIGSCTFTADGTSEYWFAFMLPSNRTADNERVWLQVEAGSSVTAYTPYANICPITGWTGANAYRTGKNVWDEVWEQGSIDNDTGEDKYASTGIRSKNYIPVVAGESYYICNLDNNNIRYYLYRSDYSFVSTGSGKNFVLTIPSDVAYLRIRSTGTYGKVYKNDFAVNYPATDTEYHAYTGQTYPVTWQTEAGTVYAGSVDVVSGVLKSRPYYPSYNGEALVGPWVSSMDEYTPGGTPTTGAQVVDLGGVETETQLTAQEVMTLVGTSNVWSDSGDVKVRYRADTKLYIDKKLSELQALILES